MVLVLVMPSRSRRTSLASITPSSIKNEYAHDRPVSSYSMEKAPTPVALSTRSHSRPRRSPYPVDDAELPPPVLAAASLASRGHKKTRIDGSIKGNLRVHWDRFIRRIGSGTAPSSSSAFEESLAESTGYSRAAARQALEDPNQEVDEVVVEREWADELKSTSTTHSEHGGTPDRVGGSNPLVGTNTDRESFAFHTPDGFWGSCTLLIWIRWRLWPFWLQFFYTKFLDERSEEYYRKENWFLRKVSVVPDCLLFVSFMSLPAEPRRLVRHLVHH